MKALFKNLRGWTTAEKFLSANTLSRRAEKYSKNSALLKKDGEAKGIIFSQSCEIFKQISIGGFKLYGNGCGAVALYNITLLVLGKADLARIIFELEYNRALRLNGLFGVSAKGIARYLEAHKIPFDKYSGTKACREQILKYPAAILYIRNKRSLSEHYYCAVKIGGELYSINRYNNQPYPARLDPEQIRGVKKVFCVSKPVRQSFLRDSLNKNNEV